MKYKKFVISAIILFSVISCISALKKYNIKSFDKLTKKLDGELFNQKKRTHI